MECNLIKTHLHPFKKIKYTPLLCYPDSKTQQIEAGTPMIHHDKRAISQVNGLPVVLVNEMKFVGIAALNRTNDRGLYPVVVHGKIDTVNKTSQIIYPMEPLICTSPGINGDTAVLRPAFPVTEWPFKTISPLLNMQITDFDLITCLICHDCTPTEIPNSLFVPKRNLYHNNGTHKNNVIFYELLQILFSNIDKLRTDDDIYQMIEERLPLINPQNIPEKAVLFDIGYIPLEPSQQPVQKHEDSDILFRICSTSIYTSNPSRKMDIFINT
jgi:hypothetical protein